MSCPHTDTVTDNARGTKMCRMCGEVLESDIIAEELQDFSGAPVKSAGAGWARAGRSFQKTATTGESSSSKMERVRQEMVVAATEMELPDFIEGALRIYQMASNTGQIAVGRQYHTMCCACLYIVCRVQRHPIEIFDFQERLQVNPYSVSKIQETLCKILNIKASGLGTAGDLVKYINALGIKNSEQVKKIEDTAQKLIDQMDKAFISDGRQPAGIRAAALYLSIRLNGFGRIQLEHVTKIVGSGNAQALNRLQELGDVQKETATGNVLPQALVRQQHFDKLITKYIKHRREQGKDVQENIHMYSKMDKDRVTRLARQKKLRKRSNIPELAKDAKKLARENINKLIEKKTKQKQKDKQKRKIEKEKRAHRAKNKTRSKKKRFKERDVSPASSCERAALSTKKIQQIKNDAKKSILAKVHDSDDSSISIGHNFADSESGGSDIEVYYSTDEADHHLSLLDWYKKDLKRQKIEQEFDSKISKDGFPDVTKPEQSDTEIGLDDFNFSDVGSTKKFMDDGSFRGTPKIEPGTPYDMGCESDASNISKLSRGGMPATFDAGLISDIVGVAEQAMTQPQGGGGSGGAEQALLDLGISFDESAFEDTKQEVDDTAVIIPSTTAIKEDIKNFSSFSDVSDDELQKIIITDDNEIYQRFEMWKSHYSSHLQSAQSRAKELEEKKKNTKKRAKRDPQASILAPSTMEVCLFLFYFCEKKKKRLKFFIEKKNQQQQNSLMILSTISNLGSNFVVTPEELISIGLGTFLETWTML